MFLELHLQRPMGLVSWALVAMLMLALLVSMNHPRHMNGGRELKLGGTLLQSLSVLYQRTAMLGLIQSVRLERGVFAIDIIDGIQIV